MRELHTPRQVLRSADQQSPGWLFAALQSPSGALVSSLANCCELILNAANGFRRPAHSDCTRVGGAHLAPK